MDDEDEFGFPTLPYAPPEDDDRAPTPAIPGLEPTFEPGFEPPFDPSGGTSLAEVLERPLEEGMVSLGVAPAGDIEGAPSELDVPPGDAPGEAPEAAARVLESLAHRVRSGEITLPAGTSGGSEAGVLAGLLAALLSRPRTRASASATGVEAEEER